MSFRYVRVSLVWALVLQVASSPALAGAAPAPSPQAPAAATPPPASARIWPEQREAIEAFMRTAEVVRMEEIPVGVTKPLRCTLAPGGPVAEMAWKPIRPGIHQGFWESYRSEIAAYELDKLLGLDMVPPTVEKRVKGDLGAAVMWVTPTTSFKQAGGMPTPPPAQFARWNRQVVRAKMFDNLIANIDPNLGNWLFDPAWNLIVIDHTRAFTPTRKLVHELTRVDRELWTRFQRLDAPALKAAIGAWVGDREIRSILERRDAMAKLVESLVARNGEAAVFMQ